MAYALSDKNNAAPHPLSRGKKGGSMMCGVTVTNAGVTTANQVITSLNYVF